jgi:hypothetical protein
MQVAQGVGGSGGRPDENTPSFMGPDVSGVGDRVVISTVTVDDHHAVSPRRRAYEFDQDPTENLRTDRESAWEILMFARGGDGNRGSDEDIWASVGESLGEFDGDTGVGVEGEMGAVLLTGPHWDCDHGRWRVGQ